MLQKQLDGTLDSIAITLLRASGRLPAVRSRGGGLCWGGLSRRGARETAPSDTTAGQVKMQGGSRQAGRHESWAGSRRNESATSRKASLMVNYGAQVSATCSTAIRIVIAYVAASMISPAFSGTAGTSSTRRVPASITGLIAPRCRG